MLYLLVYPTCNVARSVFSETHEFSCGRQMLDTGWSRFCDVSGWDPKLILMQIAAVQMGYYVCLGVLACFLDLVFGAPPSLHQLFDVKLPFFENSQSGIAMVAVLLAAPVGYEFTSLSFLSFSCLSTELHYYFYFIFVSATYSSFCSSPFW